MFVYSTKDLQEYYKPHTPNMYFYIACMANTSNYYYCKVVTLLLTIHLLVHDSCAKTQGNVIQNYIGYPCTSNYIPSLSANWITTGMY